MNSFELETADLSDEGQREDFWFRNALDHREWIDYALDNSIGITEFPVFVVTEDNLEEFLRDHDQMHRTIAELLNLGTTPDLTELTFDDPKLMSQWVDSHSQLHIQINAALGLS